VRVAIAFGPMLAREGDVFGPCVSLASRMVNLALPGTVLVSEGAREQVVEDPRFDTRPLPHRPLKDFGVIQPWVARRTSPRGGHGGPPPHHRRTRLARSVATDGTAPTDTG
jgi:adenylate cyclase